MGEDENIIYITEQKYKEIKACKKELKKFINDFKKDYYEIITSRSLFAYGLYMTEYIIKRTEMSKEKYLSIYTDPSYKYFTYEVKFEKVGYDPDITCSNECCLQYEDFIKEIESIIYFLGITLKRCIIICEKQKEMEFIKIEEPEITILEESKYKPKGNPFSGETWKDRKHKFKGGR